jgi:sec-independent protein translocase protein TatB
MVIMFNISFAELMIIAVVGLLVIGPDKLPQVARTVGAFMARLQRYVAQVKEEINREARFEDLQNLQREIQEGARQVKSSIMDSANEVRSTVVEVEDSVQLKRQSKATKPSVKKEPVKSTTSKRLVKKSPTQIVKAHSKRTVAKTAQKIEKA